MNNTKVMYIGLLGLGTVGSGVVKSLASNREHIERRIGLSIAVRHALVRDLCKPRRVMLDSDILTIDAKKIIDDPLISVVVEVMGGVEPARAMILEALQAGKHVITANKELLAKHGDELIAMAEQQNVRLLFEASVGGGIPIVRMLEAYLTANRIYSIRGILNGTCNYILTQMEEQGESFAAALSAAQDLGYAESNPESDVEGFDAAYKVSILANMAFPVSTHIGNVIRQGITAIMPEDVAAARDLGGTIKLIGQAEYVDGRAILRVGPRILPKDDPLATVRDVFNAVTVSADVVGDLTFIGRGAGEFPTASAVIEDLMEVVRSPHPHGMRMPAVPSVREQSQEGNGLATFYVRISGMHAALRARLTEAIAEWESRGSKVCTLESNDRSSECATWRGLIGEVTPSAVDEWIAALRPSGRLILPYDGTWPNNSHISAASEGEDLVNSATLLADSRNG